MMQNCALGVSWLHFAGWLQNSSKLCSGSFLAPLCGLAPEYSKTMFWELPGSTLRAGTRMLQNCALGTSWLELRAGSRIHRNCVLGASWGSTLRTGHRMLQNCALGASWLHFAGGLQNSSKLCSGSFLGTNGLLVLLDPAVCPRCAHHFLLLRV